MVNASILVGRPANEKVLTYGPGTPEREAIKSAIRGMTESPIEVPLIIGGKEVRTGRTAETVK
jgi:1-pyrroline-5-carboxylate dehydrogenase